MCQGVFSTPCQHDAARGASAMPPLISAPQGTVVPVGLVWDSGSVSLHVQIIGCEMCLLALVCGYICLFCWWHHKKVELSLWIWKKSANVFVPLAYFFHSFLFFFFYTKLVFKKWNMNLMVRFALTSE